MRLLPLKGCSVIHDNRSDQKESRFYVVPVGSLSNQLFKGMVQCSTLFFTEGSNSIGQCIRYKNAYISVVSKDNYYNQIECLYGEEDYNLLSPLPQSYDDTGSSRETMIMSLASQCVRVNVSKSNLKHTLKYFKLIYTLLMDVAFLSGFILVKNGDSNRSYSLIVNYFMRTLRALKNLPNGSFDIVSFLYYNFMAGNFSFI
ncbi:MAG: hypothetical protein KAG53_12255 [Endozoicomonadaceae bacterium]|nr:hypothetical protein [Endozoicomonadaceae bacterium]